MIIINYQKNFSAPVEQLTKEAFDEILDGTVTKVVCNQIASTDDEERKNDFKRNLRPIIWQTSEFKDNRRKKGDVVKPSYLCMVDIDHYEGDPHELFNNLLPKLMEAGMVCAHLSARGRGLHIILPVPDGIEVEMGENGRGVYLALLYFALYLGVDVDMQCQDLSRASFTPWRKSFLYINEEVLFGDKELVRPKADPEILAKIQTPDLPLNGEDAHTAPTSAEPGPVLQSAETAALPTNYQGIPLSLIFDCLEELMGGKPAEGSRNSHIYGFVGQARHLLDGKEEWIMAYLAQCDYYGLSEQEVRRTVKSALSKAVVSAMPKTLQRAIEMARMRMADETEEEKPLLPEFAEEPPQMPEDLPFILKHLCKNVPDAVKPAVLNSSFPCLNAHLHQVRVKTANNRMREPRFLHCIIGESGSGKSLIEEPIEALTKDLRECDLEVEEKLREWANKDKTKGSQEKKELKPEVVRHCPTFDFSAAALSEQLVNNEMGGCWPTYENLPELKLLNKLDPKSGDGVFIDLAYDTQLWGQQRLTSQGYTGRAHIRLDFNSSSTIAKAQDFFKGNMEDGKFNRFYISCILQDDPYQIYELGEYDN